MLKIHHPHGFPYEQEVVSEFARVMEAIKAVPVGQLKVELSEVMLCYKFVRLAQFLAQLLSYSRPFLFIPVAGLVELGLDSVVIDSRGKNEVGKILVGSDNAVNGIIQSSISIPNIIIILTAVLSINKKECYSPNKDDYGNYQSGQALSVIESL